MSEYLTKTPEALGAEIRGLTQQARTMTVMYAVEIGRRLKAAKEMIPYGGWGEWIKKETDFSQATATRFMRVFEEYADQQIGLFGASADSSTLKNLSVSNALRLLAVPEEEREDFAREVDAEHISARELEQAIKERDEAVRRAEAAEKEKQEAEQTVKEYSEENVELADNLANAEKRVKELESRPVEVAVQAPDPAEIEKAVSKAIQDEKAAAKEREKKLRDAVGQQKVAQAALRKQLDEAEKQLQAAQEAARSAEGSGEALQKAQAEAEKLRKQLAMSGEQLTVFKLRFAAWQQAYHEMKKALEAVPEEAKANCEAAVRAVLEGWT